jgi:energy-coupling factor transporter transmembrane protein EcfT
MDDRQAAIDSGSSSPLWLIIAGVVILIIGLNALVFGPLGLVLLIVGGLLALAGCVVIALRKWTRS